MSGIFDNSTLDIALYQDDDQMWVPNRGFITLGNRYIQNQLTRLNQTVLAVPTVAATPPPTGTPLQVTSVSATESPFRTDDGTMKSNVEISFVVDPSDTFFDHVQIWFTGYNGNAQAQLMPGDTHTSPASFLCDITGETVTVTVVAVGSTGIAADITFAPTTTVALDGVTSAPAAPTVTQSALPIFGGIQFSFDQLTGLAADQVQCYKVYRNTSNTTSGAPVVATITHDTKNAGITTTFQDSNIVATIAYFYWLTAVNTSGLESTFTFAGTSSGNFSMPVETINLLGNPATQGTGTLPTANHLVNEQWQGALFFGSTASPEYRNGRDIRLPFNGGGSQFNLVCQSKSISRFKPSQVITYSFRLRRDTSVASPNGDVNMFIQPVADSGNGITGGPVGTPINVSSLDGTYKLFKATISLDLVGGQSQWMFGLFSTSSNCDVFMTEPMLNNGNDAAPFTTNTFLTDVPQYAFEGASFAADDFTDPSNAVLVSTPGGHLPTAGGGAAGTGVGRMWNTFFETGTCNIGAIGTVARLEWAGAPQRTIAWNLATALSVAYYVQADVGLGSSTGITSVESGVVGRLTDQNNFYLARLDDSGGTFSLDLFKRVAGTYTLLGTFAPGSITSGTIKLQITDAAKVVIFNGTQRITSSDNTLSSAGMAGIWQGMNVTASTVSTSTDNFTAVYIQNVAAPPAPPAAPPSPPPPIDYDPVRELPGL